MSRAVLKADNIVIIENSPRRLQHALVFHALGKPGQAPLLLGHAIRLGIRECRRVLCTLLAEARHQVLHAGDGHEHGWKDDMHGRLVPAIREDAVPGSVDKPVIKVLRQGTLIDHVLGQLNHLLGCPAPFGIYLLHGLTGLVHDGLVVHVQLKQFASGLGRGLIVSVQVLIQRLFETIILAQPVALSCCADLPQRQMVALPLVESLGDGNHFCIRLQQKSA